MFSISSSKRTPALAAVFSKAYRLTTTMSMAAMHLGMQRLDPPIQHFREPSQLGNVFDGDARFAQQFSRASGRNQLHAQRSESAGEIDQSGFIGDAQDGALDLRHEFLGANENYKREILTGASSGLLYTHKCAIITHHYTSRI